LVLLLPLLFSGCCTDLMVDNATHAFRHDHVERIEKAGITPDDTLVILVHGSTAESPRVKPFTLTIALPRDEETVWMPQTGMTDGWDEAFFSGANVMPVTVGPLVVLPAYQSPRGNPQRFATINGVKRALYLVRHEEPDGQSGLFYIADGDHPRKIDIALNGRDVKTPRRYPLLLFVPITLCADVAILPFEIYFLSTYGEKPHPPPQVISNCVVKLHLRSFAITKPFFPLPLRTMCLNTFIPHENFTCQCAFDHSHDVCGDSDG